MDVNSITKDNRHTWLIIGRIFLILLIIVWMYVIFSFSAQNATDSTAASSKVVEIFSRIIQITTGKNVEFAINTKYRVYVEFGIRKCAHMFIYFILSINVMLFLFTFERIPMIIRMLLSVFTCFLYACTDEFHQAFVAGRGSSFRDVLIDTTGAALGLIAALIIYCIIYTIYHRHQEHKIERYNRSIASNEDDY